MANSLLTCDNWILYFHPFELLVYVNGIWTFGICLLSMGSQRLSFIISLNSSSCSEVLGTDNRSRTRGFLVYLVLVLGVCDSTGVNRTDNNEIGKRISGRLL
ncbi:hypothetical protein C2G38_2136750 [Gigaspora rosea]|uniref:Uncharacterized protein n=1 Tax=Gigaspora rosea TaxID=44941 RepID=A0A397W5X7_9GLOM|nr:hypothetical protein C2G38_2136750 [Gigaspora rosea]